MKFFRNFPYDDNFDLKNFLINIIIKDFSHRSFCYIKKKLAKTINIPINHLKRGYLSVKVKKNMKFLKKAIFNLI